MSKYATSFESSTKSSRKSRSTSTDFDFDDESIERGPRPRKGPGEYTSTLSADERILATIELDERITWSEEQAEEWLAKYYPDVTIARHATRYFSYELPDGFSSKHYVSRIQVMRALLENF